MIDQTRIALSAERKNTLRSTSARSRFVHCLIRQLGSKVKTGYYIFMLAIYSTNPNDRMVSGRPATKQV